MITISDDFAALDLNNHSFYYGYEETLCAKHKKQHDCIKADCDEYEWAFVFKKDEEVILKLSQSEIEKLGTGHYWGNCNDYLLFGIGICIERGLV